jgi:hypothetical protein
MKNLNKKLNIQLFCAIILIIAGIGLLIAGFIIPPQGVIDASVLTAFGEILTFVGALFGIDYHYKYKSSLKGNSTFKKNTFKKISNTSNSSNPSVNFSAVSHEDDK